MVTLSDRFQRARACYNRLFVAILQSKSMHCALHQGQHVCLCGGGDVDMFNCICTV